MSSCCGGKCGCGSSCGCGSNCNGCGKYPDLSYTESTTSVTLIMGVAPTEKPHLEGFEKGVEAGNNGGCSCGDNCTCNPCKCGK